MTYKAYYYLKSNGQSPLENYLQKIKDSRVLVAIGVLIDRLIHTKCNLPYGIIKPVKGKIYELRLTRFKNQHRIFYFILKRGKIILLDGYAKKTNKIPKKILNKIEKYYSDYLTNHYERIYIRKNT